MANVKLKHPKYTKSIMEQLNDSAFTENPCAVVILPSERGIVAAVDKTIQCGKNTVLMLQCRPIDRIRNPNQVIILKRIDVEYNAEQIDSAIDILITLEKGMPQR